MVKARSERFSVISKILTLVIFLSYSTTSFSQEKENDINIGLVYPLSMQGWHSIEHSNVFSLHAIMGMSREERGFTAAGFANVIRRDANGFQAAGFLNSIGGSADGFKAAGFMNLYHNARGFQAAGFANLANGDVTGMQAAGFINIADDFRGFQGAGFINIAEDINGTQAAGFVNIAEEVDGTQIAGFVNVAKKVKGAQIAGFINIADSSEYPIGIVNIIRNGEKYLGITTDDNFTTLFTFRSGSKKLYGVLGAGYNFKNEKDVLALQYGLGAHLANYRGFRLNAEGTVTHLENFRKGDFVKTSLSVLPALKGKRMEIFAGPSVNYVNTNSTDGRDLINHYAWHRKSHDNNREHGIYIGYTAGIHFAL